MRACDHCFFIFYFLINGFTILSLCTFSQDFFHRFSITYHFLLFSNAFVSAYLFLTIRKDPGIIRRNSERGGSFKVEITFDSEVSNESIPVTTTENDNDYHQMFRKECKICDVEIPMRGKHCSRCGHCIRKFDHHCVLVGGCIGERNHFRFYSYLLTQTITIILAIGAILDTVSFYLERTKEKYSKVPFILYALLIILTAYLLLTTVLFCFHTYLIMTNQTTYEIYRSSKLPYVNKFRELKRQKLINSNIKIPPNTPFHPFDMGFKRNWGFLYNNDKEYDWVPIYKENLESLQIKFNWCDNAYWSCF